MKLRVLVIDDTAVYRKIISDILSEIPDVQVIGTASNGVTALAHIKSLHPDLATLDIEMPEMNGLEVLETIRDQGIKIGVIVLSAFTQKGSELTIKALELGAFDFITKSTEGSPEQNRLTLYKKLATLIQTFIHQKHLDEIRQRIPTRSENARIIPQPERPQTSLRKLRAEMVLIGVSTGGPNALAQVLPKLPPDLGVPVLIVQHMPPLFTSSLAQSLDRQCRIRVKEAENNEPAQPNIAYIAPGGKHMKLTADTGNYPIIQINDDPPENHCKPAADVLFRSAAYAFPGRACVVIMTGMGNDGTLGLRLIKRHPAHVIAQDEESCVVFGMPKEAIAAGVVDIIVPLVEIANEISKAVKGY